MIRRSNARPNRGARAGAFVALSAVVAIGSACSFRRPADETPAPRPADSVVVDKRKGFFGQFQSQDYVSQPEIRDAKGRLISAAVVSQRSVFKPKTFLCGWATEAEAGAFAADFEHGVEAISHCNVEFEITEKSLVARQVNPSFPNDRSRWEIVLTIPIESHFYYEQEKDSAGRDTSKWIENSSRSRFEARPLMRLKLSEMEIQTFRMWDSGLGKALFVDDVEWDEANGFLGFTATTNLWRSDCYWSSCVEGNAQARYRVNFLELKPNPTFKKTPFSDADYKYMNVLHVVGKRAQGVYETLYAAHWDLAKNPKFYLQNVPEAYKPIVADVVAEWNVALRKAGALAEGQPGFQISTETPKHAFDLRYPTIYWVSDRRISERSPLGVGMAHADVRTGEIVWGMVTLYGGLLEQYIKSYMPIEGGAANAFGAGSQALAEKLFGFGDMFALAPGLDFASQIATRASMPGAFSRMPGIVAAEDVRAAQAEVERRLAAAAPDARRIAGFTGATAEDASSAMRKLAAEKGLLSPDQASEIASAIAASASQRRSAFQSSPMPRAMQEKLRAPLAGLAQFDGRGAQRFSGTTSAAPPAREQAEGAEQRRATARLHTNIFDADLTFQEVGPSFAAAMKDYQGDYRDVVRVLVKELSSHEVGHVIGLGHQFKENILPDSGSVPEKYLSGEGWKENLSGRPRPGLRELADEAHGWTNATSVMGYRDPRTDIASRYELVGPGPQDTLTLQYIYTRRYSAYRAGDADFTPIEVPIDGIIPATPPGMPEGYKTAYFPQCNDVEASLTMDPYCNRFDRGSTATDIAKNYVDSLDANLAQTLAAFTDARGGNAWNRYAYLWIRSFSTMSRLRIFYDYMRGASEFRPLLNEIRSDEKLLLDFSLACTSDAASVQPRMREIMDQNPRFKELCAVNAYSMRQYAKYLGLSAPDETRVDRENRFVPGGIRGGDIDEDFSRYDGTWTELSGLPLKYAALWAMQSPQPWWQAGFYMLNVPGYADGDSRVQYSWLYPREFTQAVASTVTANLKFVGVDQTDRPLMGRAVLAMSYFNALSRLPNDQKLFPPRYVRRVRGQTEFDLGVVAIVIRAETKDGPKQKTHVDKFTGDVYDFGQGQKSSLSSAYLLQDGQVLAQAPGMFLYPITKFKLLDDRLGYVLAYKMNYFFDRDNDPFADVSAKSQLLYKYDALIHACIAGPPGQNNGLETFFTKTEKEFDGFYMPEGLYVDPIEKGANFLNSVKDSFDRYYSSKKYGAKPPKPSTCDGAIEGQGLIISAAAVLNGYWLPEVNGYLQ